MGPEGGIQQHICARPIRVIQNLISQLAGSKETGSGTDWAEAWWMIIREM
jgi:hypothetical protein